jgi:hypothetical protein
MEKIIAKTMPNLHCQEIDILRIFENRSEMIIVASMLEEPTGENKEPIFICYRSLMSQNSLVTFGRKFD